MAEKKLIVGILPKASGEAFIFTPEWCQWALESFNTHNRRLMDKVIERYAADMRAGNWQCIHQGISFSEPPTAIIDGQHRLWAVVKSGVNVIMRLFTNEPMAGQLVTDDQAIRAASDALTLAGYPTTKQEAAIANAMLAGTRMGVGAFRMSKTILQEFLATHHDAIAFALSFYTRKTKGFTASTMAAIARAYYYAEKEKIAPFVETLLTGIPARSDETLNCALALRRFLIESNVAGSSGRAESYRKTQKMLRAYLDGLSLSKCTGTDIDLFPLPTQSNGKP